MNFTGSLLSYTKINDTYSKFKLSVSINGGVPFDKQLLVVNKSFLFDSLSDIGVAGEFEGTFKDENALMSLDFSTATFRKTNFSINSLWTLFSRDKYSDDEAVALESYYSLLRRIFSGVAPEDKESLDLLCNSVDKMVLADLVYLSALSDQEWVQELINS